MPPFVEWPITIKENKIIKIADMFPIKKIFLNFTGKKYINMKPINKRREAFRAKVSIDKLIMLVSIIPKKSPDIFPGIEKINMKEIRTPNLVNF